MKKCFSGVAVFLILIIFSQTGISAEISEIGPSARAISMGRAYTAYENTVDCAISNPAGLANIDSVRFSSMYSPLNNDFSYNNFSCAIPFKYGVFALSILNQTSGVLYKTSVDSNGRVILDSATPFNFYNQVFNFSLANKYNKFINFGGRLKVINKGATYLSNATGSGIAFDFGLIYFRDEKTNVGLYLENFINSGISWPTGNRDFLPVRFSSGLTHKLNKNVLAAFDVVFSSNWPIQLKAGAEWKAAQNLYLRAGLETEDIGNKKYFDYALGIGSAIENFYIHYAYKSNINLPESSSHFISMGIDFVPVKTKVPTMETVKTVVTTQEEKKEVVQPITQVSKDLTKLVLYEKRKQELQDQLIKIDNQITRAKKIRNFRLIRRLNLQKSKILDEWQTISREIENLTTRTTQESVEKINR